MKFVYQTSCAMLALALSTAFAKQAPSTSSPLDVLMVGGGPTPEYNQIAIESNVRYLNHILPPNSQITTFFADGNLNHATVKEETQDLKKSTPSPLLNLIVFENPAGPDQIKMKYPQLGGPLDGPSKHSSIRKWFDTTAKSYQSGTETSPLLLYFTGHGSPDGADYNNNYYDLWGAHNGLSVQQLSHYLTQIPSNVETTLIMVQCFSGSFGNLLFKGGLPNGKYTETNLCGYFAAIPTLPAAGCTTDVNESDYHDFTSYFFAALSGRDRFGKKVTGADYNHDGKVGMNEAYCYSLIHDTSIDVPMCTSDVFLRRYEQHGQPDFTIPFAQVVSEADPAQKAALTGMAKLLHISGENCAEIEYKQMLNHPPGLNEDNDSKQWMNFLSDLTKCRNQVMKRFPNLRSFDDLMHSPNTEKSVIEWINRQKRKAPWNELMSAYQADAKVSELGNEEERKSALRLRFLRLYNSVVLAKKLMDSSDTKRIRQYEHLVSLEDQPLIPPASSWNAQPAK